MELTGGPKPAATKGDTTNGLFTLITSAVDGRKVEKIRPHLHLGSLSGDIEVRVMVQTSDDLVTWSTPSTLTGYTSFVSSAGWTWGTSWVTPTGAPYFRLGVEARNINNSERDCARVRLAVDLLFT
jgi:hypothetical protein